MYRHPVSLLLVLALAVPDLFLPALAGGSADADASVNAVHKVIELMTDMSVNAKAGKKAESVEYAKFEQFCTDKTASKTQEIKKGAELMESLTASIAKLDADILGLSKSLDEFDATIGKSQAGLQEAKAQREKDKEGYNQAIDAHAEAVDALERAIAVLQKQNYDRKQAASALLQLSSVGMLPELAQREVAAFLETQSGDDFITREGPEPQGYEFQSGHIVEILKRLLTEFTEKHTQSQKEEMNSKHAYDMIMQDLTDTIEGAKSDIADHTARLQEKRLIHVEDSKRLASATATHAEDVKFLSDLRVECLEKGKSYQEKQALRDEEIMAIEKAIEILQSDEVLGSAEKHLWGAALPQLSATAHALVQLSSDAARRGVPETRRALASFLTSEGQRLGSQQLGLLAQQVITSSDPFSKVKQLIQDLIHKLLREAGEEAEHKGWCDTEMGTNKQTRTKLQADIDGLQARIDQGEASITEMTERLSVLAAEVQDLVESMNKATDLRASEKAKNLATTEDAQAAQKAIAAATAILKDFYAKAGEATALMQMSASRKPIQYDRIGNEEVKMGSEEWKSLANPDAPEVDRGHKEGMHTFGNTYKGRRDEAGGVLAILEVVASDFSTLEADTNAAEDEAASTYKTFMADSKKNMAVKERESDMLLSDKTEAETRLATDTTDIKNTQDRMLAAERYHETLKPQCIDQGVTFQARAKARQDEIQSLQEALRILSSDDI